jgi:hypothetical protein
MLKLSCLRPEKRAHASFCNRGIELLNLLFIKARGGVPLYCILQAHLKRLRVCGKNYVALLELTKGICHIVRLLYVWPNLLQQ